MDAAQDFMPQLGNAFEQKACDVGITAPCDILRGFWPGSERMKLSTCQRTVWKGTLRGFCSAADETD